MDFTALASALASDPSALRIRQGVIVSVQPDATATLTIAGSGAQVVGVKVLDSCVPRSGDTCWIATDGRDLWVIGHLAGIAGPSGTPAGTLEYFARATPPPGWLKCDGSPVSRAAYAALWACAQGLFAATGSYSPYGAGDGSTTFNLPTSAPGELRCVKA